MSALVWAGLIAASVLIWWGIVQAVTSLPLF